ncbi:MAG: hypothetical protein ACLT8E_11205 [Akkermansia sp.]
METPEENSLRWNGCWTACSARVAEQYPVFLVNREEVVRRLHLPDQKDKRKKYSYAQLAERWEEMTRAVREIRLLGETNLTEAQKEILSLARNFDVVRGWMLGSRIMLEDPAAMERMDFPRWFLCGPT